MQLLRNTRNRALAVGAAAIATAAVMAPAAVAQSPTGNFAVFKNCPRANAATIFCFQAETNSGRFQLGNADVPINKKIVVQGGVGNNGTNYTFINPVNGVPALQRVPLNVPGGLTGLFDPQPGWNGLLTELVEAAINAANGVTATAETVGPVGIDLDAFTGGYGIGLTLPVRIKLDNPFLGDSCYIGSASTPVTLRLSTGTTAPPPPNTPIVGTPGTVNFPPNGDAIIGLDGFRAVDNSFAVPKASGCGPLLFRPLINAAVNLKEGFPSAAGRNTADLRGNARLADVAAVNANAAGQ